VGKWVPLFSSFLFVLILFFFSSINTFTDQTASNESKVFGEEPEETEVFTAAERSNDKLLTPTSILAPDITQQQSTPSSTASSTSFFRNILHSNTSNKDDSQGRLSYFSPGSSLGCTPLHSKKRLSVSFNFSSFFVVYIRV